MCLQQMPPEDKWLPVALATTALSFSFAVFPETKCLKSNIYIYMFVQEQSNPNET